MKTAAAPVTQALRFLNGILCYLRNNVCIYAVTEEETFRDVTLDPQEWELLNDPRATLSTQVYSRVMIRHADNTVYAIINGQRWKRRR